MNIRLAILLYTVLLAAQQVSSLPQFWPRPQSLTLNESAAPIFISPCDVKYIVESPISPYVENILAWYLSRVFKCSSNSTSNYTMNIVVPTRMINIPLETDQEVYSLTIPSSGRWILRSDEYAGFLRGLETYSQLFE
jgi:hypothetical protein